MTALLRLFRGSGARLAVALAAVVVAISAPAALAAGTPGWRVAAVFGPRTGVTYVGSLVATGRTDAWSTWTICSPCGSNSVRSAVVEHWNGRRWVTMSSPTLDSYAAGFLAASSARDAWLFKGAYQRHALHWNGRSWTLRAIPTWVVRVGFGSGIVNAITADFGPSNLWVFSNANDPSAKPYAARYHDGRWSKAILPAFPGQVSALAPDDIWATGYRVTSSGTMSTQVLMHWNGRSWRTMSIPAPTNVPPHANEYAGNLVALGPADIWLTRDLLAGSQGARTLYLMHWNGTRWGRVYFKYRTSFVDNLAQDGHGGIWIVANGPSPGYRWYFYHLNSGHWSRQLAPATTSTTFQQIRLMTWIPGTRSLWAAGGLLPSQKTGVLGAVFRYRN